MSNDHDDAGVIQVLLDRFNNHRLPRALELKGKVDRGEKLENYEIDYLAKILADTHALKALRERHPEYNDLVIKMLSLYTEITEKAVANESKE